MYYFYLKLRKLCFVETVYYGVLKIIISAQNKPMNDTVNPPFFSSWLLRGKKLRPSFHHTAALSRERLCGALSSFSSMCLGEN